MTAAPTHNAQQETARTLDRTVTTHARRQRVDALPLAEFRRFLNEGLRLLDESKAVIERSQATLARAYERLERLPARERPRRHSDLAPLDASGPGPATERRARVAR